MWYHDKDSNGGEMMGQNGKRAQMIRNTEDEMDKRTSARKRKEQKLVEIATDIAIELYGPALKELEKH